MPVVATPPCRSRTPRRARRGIIVIVATLMFSLEPSLSLVILALGLSALAAVWIAMLGTLLIKDSWARLASILKHPRAAG